MRNATRVMVSTFGAFVGLIGVEHGIGETLQGNITPDGLMILSWPDSALFRILGGEPAMTVVPNLLVTGILAILVSLIYVVWAVAFVQRKNGGLILMLLAIIMLPVGGGIFPPILGIIISVVGTRINAPLTWWRAHLSAGSRRFLAKLWPWSFGAGLIAWLGMFPGTVLLWHFWGVNSPNLVFVLLLCMFGFLASTVLAGFAYDIQRQTGSYQAPAIMSEQPVSPVHS
jgi:hypothetical protein